MIQSKNVDDTQMENKKEEESMEKIFKNALWIWSNDKPESDEYGEFVDCFRYEKGSVLLRISADSNYAVYLNGRLAVWGQYADFPYDKIYDEVDITKYCKNGDNRIAILVWYYGIDTTQVYYPGNAGLLYEVICDEEILCESNERTWSRKSKAYVSHRKKQITRQLGFSYRYNAVKEDDWLTGCLNDFVPATIVEQRLPLRIRPCDKLTLLPEVKGEEHKRITDTDIIFDLGSEQVGFLSFQVESSSEQEILISYGEHLLDGCVRQKIEERDFSVSYYAKKGENDFLNPFRRLGCRYLEIHSESPLVIKKIALAPTMYVLEEKERPKLSAKQNKIYDMCVETLRLCMHEHYEDCPWREQALYTMDSRNQMLCGYYAFGEYRFPHANLELISKDNRKDGLLSICYPIKWDYVIPSFSLHYVMECREYMDYSGDKGFLEKIYPKLVSIVETFTNRLKNGLVPPFLEENYWNFYEWREGLNGEGDISSEPDLILNTLLSLALQNMAVIAETLGRGHTYLEQAEQLNEHILDAFWSKEEKVFYNLPEHRAYSQLGNALAILCGAIEGKEAEELCERIRMDVCMTPISLSMQCFKYDAWIKVDKERYGDMILEDIENTYTPMIESGSTTVWETELGEADFQGAGSLCHGWSALPIYYYHILTT